MDRRPHDMAAFLAGTCDAYGIMQLKDRDDLADRRFRSADYLYQQGIVPSTDDYDLWYEEVIGEITDTTAFLDKLYVEFNIRRPSDFQGHSLSVSDVIAVRQQGKMEFYFVNSIGFKKVEMQR